MKEANEVVFKTDLPDIKLFKRGKVRDVYEVDDQLLIVATDRISAFDVVMADPIPGKGKILTQISAYWFSIMGDIIPNHLISTRVEEFPTECQRYAHLLKGRSMLVARTDPLPVECVVRGYLAGSAWQEYQETGGVSGIELPQGLVEAAKLPRPLFTPATKVESGEHDQNITFAQMAQMVGMGVAQRLRDISIAIYERACRLAEEKGIIIADSKFEFGIKDGGIILIDELLTPDSSRFWSAERYRPGGGQDSFDKQFLRDYLVSLAWDKSPPPPPLPTEIIAKTKERYEEALRRLVGEEVKV